MNKEQIQEILLKNKDKYYVYSLNSNNKPFYIGKGKNTRIFSHEKELNREINEHSNLHKIHKLQNAINNDNLSYSIYEFFINEFEAFELEKSIINKYGRSNLTNLTDGGKGIIHLSETSKNKRIIKLKQLPKKTFSRVFSDESKKKMSDAKKGKKPWNYGKEMSDDFKIKCSESKKGHIPWNKGISRTNETNKKISEKRKGFKHSEQTKEKMRESQQRMSKESKLKRIEKTIYNNKNRIRSIEEKVLVSNKNKQTAMEKVKIYNIIKQYIKEFNLDIDFPRYGKSLSFLYETLEKIKPLVEEKGGTINV